MGQLYIADGICPVTDQMKKSETYETKSCVHCQAVIVVLKRGCSTEWTAKAACTRCHGPLCKFCAKKLVENKGECDGGIQSKIDNAVKTGRWNNNHRHRYSIYSLL